jgi:hypothetical protein
MSEPKRYQLTRRGNDMHRALDNMFAMEDIPLSKAQIELREVLEFFMELRTELAFKLNFGARPYLTISNLVYRGFIEAAYDEEDYVGPRDSIRRNLDDNYREK